MMVVLPVVFLAIAERRYFLHQIVSWPSATFATAARAAAGSVHGPQFIAIFRVSVIDIQLLPSCRGAGWIARKSSRSTSC